MLDASLGLQLLAPVPPAWATLPRKPGSKSVVFDDGKSPTPMTNVSMGPPSEAGSLSSAVASSTHGLVV